MGAIRRVTKPIRRALAKPLLAAAVAVLPWVYKLYMGLVWNTSRVERQGVEKAQEAADRFGGVSLAIYHEACLVGVQLGREYPIVTVASYSDSGEVITAVGERAGLTVIRGGSSRSRKRRTPVVRKIAAHCKEHSTPVACLTVDGSSGPRRHVKPGIVDVARATGYPLFAVHGTSSLCFRLPSWDKTIVPLPFGRIRLHLDGYIEVPPDCTSEQREAIRQQLSDLMAATAESAEG